jgi:hypothetical protein
MDNQQGADGAGHHIYPPNDLKDHVLDRGGTCWCKPEELEGIWIHNSMDKREEYDNGRQKH